MRLSDIERRLVTAALALAVVALALWVAARIWDIVAAIADVVLVFVVAWAIAYLLTPPVGWLHARLHLARVAAVALVYVALFIVVTVLGALAVPVLAAQLVGLADSAPVYGERLAGIVSGVQDAFVSRGIPLDVTALYGALPERLAAFAGALASNTVAVLGSVFAIFFDVTLVLIVAFFMLLDGDRLWRDFVGVLPRTLRSEAELFRLSADRSFGGFLRGSLIVGAIYGVASWLVLVFAGVPFAAVLGAAGGLLMIIPFFGAFIAMIPPVLLALTQGLPTLVVTFIALFVLQFVLLNIVSPRLMAETVGLHPLFVFLALLVGAHVAGFWGVFLAVPVAGIINVFARYFTELALGRRARTEAHRVVEEEAIDPKTGEVPS